MLKNLGNKNKNLRRRWIIKFTIFAAYALDCIVSYFLFTVVLISYLLSHTSNRYKLFMIYASVDK